MAGFFANHWLALVIVATAVVWIAAIVCYIGPETWSHWQMRHWRWLTRQ